MRGVGQKKPNFSVGNLKRCILWTSIVSVTVSRNALLYEEDSREILIIECENIWPASLQSNQQRHPVRGPGENDGLTAEKFAQKMRELFVSESGVRLLCRIILRVSKFDGLIIQQKLTIANSARCFTVKVR